MVADQWTDEGKPQYAALLQQELAENAHGEVDEASWALKQAMGRRITALKPQNKPFREYARQSFIDTLTLYLHGICCDIDVETGPRQLPSRLLRKRLQLIRGLYPPPTGYSVLPEELKKK